MDEKRIIKIYLEERDGSTIIDNHGYWALAIKVGNETKLIELGHSFDDACLSCFWGEYETKIMDLETTPEIMEWLKETDGFASMEGGKT